MNTAKQDDTQRKRAYNVKGEPMTAQEIADEYGDPSWVSTLKKEIESYAAERVAEAVSECAKAVRKSYPNCDAIVAAILSVAAPKPPVWHHKPGCPTPYQRVNGLWQYQKDGPLSAYCHTDHAELRFCPGCGAEKPEVKP